jgi:hypothetical protein
MASDVSASSAAVISSSRSILVSNPIFLYQLHWQRLSKKDERFRSQII